MPKEALQSLQEHYLIAIVNIPHPFTAESLLELYKIGAVYVDALEELGELEWAELQRKVMRDWAWYWWLLQVKGE